jgi:hypothetical protein
MGKLLVKPGVNFGDCLAPAGARILTVLANCVRGYAFNVTITSARDGVHSGPQDPHALGEAFDLRTNDLTDLQKNLLLANLQQELGAKFYAFLEAPGTPNEHIHVQRRKGTTFSVLDYLAA